MLLCWRFYSERKKYYAQKRKEARARVKMQELAKEI